MANEESASRRSPCGTGETGQAGRNANRGVIAGTGPREELHAASAGELWTEHDASRLSCPEVRGLASKLSYADTHSHWFRAVPRDGNLQASLV